MGSGIDYGRGVTNIDTKTGIRYGVISQNEVLQAWADSSESYYGKPEFVECPKCKGNPSLPKGTKWGDTITCDCEVPNPEYDEGADGDGEPELVECGAEIEVEIPCGAEPISYYVDDSEYSAECGESGDIFVQKSPYYTRARYCSPCAPGACSLTCPDEDGDKAYCFGHDWFDGSVAPYPVYRVSDDTLVEPETRN